MARLSLAVLCLLSGAGLLIAGLTWNWFVSPKLYWGPEQAQEFTEASRALKTVATRAGRKANHAPDPQLDEAQARFDKIQTKLNRAIVARDYSGPILDICGVAMLALGGWLFWTSPPRDGRSGDRWDQPFVVRSKN